MTLTKFIIGNATTIAALVTLSYFMYNAMDRNAELSIDLRVSDRQAIQILNVADFWKDEARKFAEVIQYCPHNGMGGEIALALMAGDDKVEWAIRTEKMYMQIFGREGKK